jgi:chorismate dehydratase
MKEVVTADGSITYHDEKYDETYHSVSGAVEEAFKKHAEPANVAERAKLGEISILDICFGLGYNSAAALDLILEANLACTVTIVGLESDKEILGKIASLKPHIKSYSAIQDAVENNGVYDHDGISIKIIVDDARKSLVALEQSFDVVFHDPFSPRKCPELWTEDFFNEIRKHMKKNGVLTTYSCARSIRENLMKAGFAVSDGPCVGRRAPSTIAKPL